MRSNVVTVSSSARLRQVRQFRYEVYVHELHVEHPNARHDSQEFFDELDEYSTNYALVDDRDQILGTLRCTLLSDLPNPQPPVKKFSMEPFVERVSCFGIATTSRFMLRPDRRKTSDILKLLKPSMEFGLKHGVRFNFGTTRPALLNYYERLGYRRYRERVEDDIFGFDLPIVMLARDMDYLSLSKSPLVRYLTPLDDDPDSRKWFNARYGMYSIFSPVGRVEENMAQICRGVGIDVKALIAGDFGCLPENVKRDFLANCSIIEFHPTDTITRAGETDKIVFVCLQGALTLSEDRSNGQEIVRPGDVIICGRLATVVADSHGLLLSLPISQSRRLSQESRSVVDEWFARVPN